MCVCVIKQDIHSVYKWLQNVHIAIYSRVVQLHESFQLDYRDHDEYVFQVRYCGVGISSLTTLSGHTGHRYPNK